MNYLTKHVIVPVLVTHKKEIIPIWDERISYEEKVDELNIIHFENQQYSHLSDYIYNLETKEFIKGIEINIKNKNQLDELEKGQSVFVEVSRNRVLEETTIKEILYENYELSIYKGSEMNSWEIEDSQIENFDRAQHYIVKRWSPSFLLENGIIAESSFRLYRKK